MISSLRSDPALGLAAGLIALAVLAGSAAAAPAPKPKPDLADAVAGEYHGDVVSDSQGSSREDVSLTLTKTGPDTVSISSDYSRLPVVTVRLERAMAQIVNRGGATPFVYNDGKLDVSFNDEVSWSGHR
ncbi:MAG: hypothetical protein JO127_11005 [Caulobacteraceae bacterium]|nr:hypothetical protein [Caulobacteraceae bacterium]